MAKITKKPRIEVVSPKMLERELTSDRFLDGLERMIEISINPRKLETLFEIEKELFGNRIAYPSQIEVGTNGSVGGVVGNYHALELYKNSLRGAGKPVYEYNEDKFDTEDFTIFCLTHELSSVDYPEVPEEFSYKQSLEGIWYPLIKIHTHPSGSLNASLNDVMIPNGHRRHTEKHGLYVKPINIIVGLHDRGLEKSYGMLFFQEKEDKPISKIEVPYSVDELHDFVNPGQNLAKLLLGVPCSDEERFNKGIGNYNIARRKISFDFDLNDFAYEAKEK